MNMTIEVRRLGRDDRIELIARTIGLLNDLGLPHVWPEARRYLARADALDQAAAALPAAPALPDDLTLATRLAEGAITPTELADLTERAENGGRADRLRALYRRAAANARISALSRVENYGDKLVEEDLRPAVTEALAAGDDARWARLCALADHLRANGLLPLKYDASSRRFNADDYRTDEDGKRGVYTASEVYSRAFGTRQAGRTVTAGTR